MFRCILVVVLIGGLVGGWAQALGGEPPSVDALFHHSEFKEVEISPDGAHLAYIVRVRDRQFLAMAPIHEPQKARLISDPNADVTWIQWANVGTVLFGLGTAKYYTRDMGGVYAVDVAGGPARILIEDYFEKGKHEGTVHHVTHLRRETTNSNSIAISMQFVGHRVKAPDAYHLDLKSGKRERFWRNPGDVYALVYDRSGKVKATLAIHDEDSEILVRDDRQNSRFVSIRKWKYTDPPISLVGATADDERLLVITDADGTGSALYEMDTQSGKLGECRFRREGFDVSGVVGRTGGEILGIRYTDDRARVKWFSPQFEAMQKVVDAALPHRSNQIGNTDDARKRAVIYSYSDQEPGEYFLLNAETGELRGLFRVNPKLSEFRLGATRSILFRARDGLSIHGYITMPPEGADRDLPMVIVPHGGPWLRDVWGYDPEVQFLAMRGYAVLQVNYRGSSGFGSRFLRAADKEWGLAMQDDLTDGVEWAISQGIADRNRIAIFGTSYGGYAAMQGLIKTPELYRCGINCAGVTDLFRYLSERNGVRDKLWRWELDHAVGRQLADLKQIEATSPVNHADKIRVPVFMAYGELDQSVNISHARQMAKALRKNGKDFKLMVKKDEGHGYIRLENQREYYGEIEKFLARHLAAR